MRVQTCFPSILCVCVSSYVRSVSTTLYYMLSALCFIVSTSLDLTHFLVECNLIISRIATGMAAYFIAMLILNVFK